MFGFLSNLDLLSVGLTVAGIAVLGFTIYFNDRKSATNRAFLFFSVISIFWGIANYVNYQFHSPQLVLWSLRAVIFFATWHAFSLLVLLYVFPKKEVIVSKKLKYILFPVVAITSLVTLSPLAFSQISNFELDAVSTVNKGPGMLLFIVVIIFNLITAFTILYRKIKKAEAEEKTQFLTIFVGLLITFLLLSIFNFLLPALFDYVQLMPLGALFILPFIIFTFYSIYKQHLFNIKDIFTVFIALALTIVTFLEIIFSQGFYQILFRVSIFTIVLIFSIRMIRDMFALEFANERLKELDKMKSEFVSLATHQIRAPLTSIKGYISLIQEGDYGPVTKEVAGALDIVMQSAVNLVTIVGDFLDVSRIELGRMKYDYTDFNFQELVQQVVTEYKPNVEKKGLTMDYTFDASKQYDVHADRGKIKQVIGNILDNSIKYTLKGFVKVELGFSPVTPNNIRVKIFDSGVGIPTATLPKLFQKFTRAENANDANILGTGLGLYVAKQMIDAHNGKVWAESEGQGKGAQFYIELPVTH